MSRSLVFIIIARWKVFSIKITIKVASIDYIWRILVKSLIYLMNWSYDYNFKMATTFSKHWFYVFAFLGHTRVLLHQSRSSGQGTGWGDLQQSTGQGRGHRIPAVHTVLHHRPSLTNLEGRTVGKESISISNIYQIIWVNWYLQNKCVTIKCLFFRLSVITT